MNALLAHELGHIKSPARFYTFEERRASEQFGDETAGRITGAAPLVSGLKKIRDYCLSQQSSAEESYYDSVVKRVDETLSKFLSLSEDPHGDLPQRQKFAEDAEKKQKEQKELERVAVASHFTAPDGKYRFNKYQPFSVLTEDGKQMVSLPVFTRAGERCVLASVSLEQGDGPVKACSTPAFEAGRAAAAVADKKHRPHH